MTSSLAERFFDIDLWLVGGAHSDPVRQLPSALSAGLETGLAAIDALQPRTPLGAEWIHRVDHPKRGETLGQYFVRLNPNFLEHVTVLEMPEGGGDLACIHGSVGAAKAIDA